MIYNYLVGMGFEVVGERCQRRIGDTLCDAPLVRRGEWTGCWECLTAGETVRRGRNLMERIKVQSEMRRCESQMQQCEDEGRLWWPEGVPL